jgi:hypothetical protein
LPVQEDKYELFSPKDLRMQAITILCSNFYSFSMYFVENPLVAVLKLFLKLLLWDIFLEILKWKLVSEILSVSRGL